MDAKMTIRWHTPTPEEREAQVREEERRRKHREACRWEAGPLSCDGCHAVIPGAYVAAFDLEGSFFFCQACKERPHEN